MGVTETAPATKLEAINAMLHDITERPVTTLSGQRLDVSRAEDSLDTVLRSVLTEGWWFNRELISLDIDANNYYTIPDNVVHVKKYSGGPTTGTNGAPVLVVRGRRLYDRVNATDVFASGPTIKLTVHRLLEYEDLPQSARDYVYAVASIRYQSRELGSKHIDQDLQRQALVARATLVDEDLAFDATDQTWTPHFFTMMHNR